MQNLKNEFKNYNNYICWLEVSNNSVRLCYTTDFSTINRRSIYNNSNVIIGDWIIVPEKNTILISISINRDLYFYIQLMAWMERFLQKANIMLLLDTIH